jgi:hypothetical protein
MSVIEHDSVGTVESDPPGGHRRKHWVWMGAVVIVLGAVVIGLTWWREADESKLKSNEKVWLAAATRALNTPFVGSNLCGNFPAGDTTSAQTDMPGYGLVAQICVLPNANLGTPQVQFLRDEQHGFGGLVYNPYDVRIDAPDACVGHLDGPWWQFQPLSSSNACPSGFQFVGGG